MTRLIEAISQAEFNHEAHKQEFNKNLKKIKADEPLIQLDESYRVNQRIERLTKGGYVGLGLERVIGPNDLLNINYLDAGLHAARSVCKIATRDKLGRITNCGTGFLVSPNLVITNHHVIDTAAIAEASEAIFEYEYNRLGALKQSVTFRLKPSVFFITSRIEELDYSIIAVDPQGLAGESLSSYGFIPLIEDIGKIIVGEHVSIIQHPNGEPKQIAIRNNQLIYLDDRFLHYETDTAPGSSGALVVNNQWEAVALHHSGVPKRKNGKILTRDGNVWSPSMGEHQIDWIANEGIRISRIIQDVKARVGLTPHQQQLRDELLEAKENRLSTPTPAPHKIIESDVPTDVPSKDNTGNVMKIDITISTGNPKVDVRIDGKPSNVDSTALQQEFPITITSRPTPLAAVRFELWLTKQLPLRTIAIQEIEARFNIQVSKVFKTNDSDNNTELSDLFETSIELKDLNVWDIARELKAIEGVLDVDPDLPTAGIEEPADDQVNFRESSNGDTNRAAIEAKHKGISCDWNISKTSFKEAVDYAHKQGRLNGQTSVKIAQIDTGYTDHPEISAVNRKGSLNFIDPKKDGRDELTDGFMKQPGHGTRTASIIIGTDTALEHDANNGVFPYVDLVPFRVANSVIILGTADNVSQAVMKAIDGGFDIITMSMGSYGRQSWRMLAEYAYNKGIFWICAAGNEVRKLFMVVRPAQYPGTIAVAATNYKDKPWNNSSRGKAVDISAPGENVYVPTLLENNGFSYSYGSGTSYATPHVAAAAALWLHFHKEELNKLYTEPWQRVEAFRTVLKKTARIPAGKWPEGMGAGILDAHALLKHKLPDPGELVHAYAKGSLESTADHTLAITEKELIHLVWNKDNLSLEESATTAVSEKTSRFLETLHASDLVVEPALESNNSDKMTAFVYQVLQSSTI